MFVTEQLFCCDKHEPLKWLHPNLSIDEVTGLEHHTLQWACETRNLVALHTKTQYGE